jgi:hypothetical protein
MSPTGRPEGECRSAQHEGTPVTAPDLRAAGAVACIDGVPPGGAATPLVQ